MKTYAIIPGWNEGKWHTKQLCQALNGAGLKQADPSNAEVIITHSGGAYLLPKQCKPALLISVGPTYLPPSQFLKAAMQKVRQDRQDYRAKGSPSKWRVKTLWNFIYFFRLDRTLTMAINLYTKNIGVLCLGERNILVRNRRDTFCQEGVCKALKGGRISLLSFSGEHDDIWTNPKPYVDLLQSLV